MLVESPASSGLAATEPFQAQPCIPGLSLSLDAVDDPGFRSSVQLPCKPGLPATTDNDGGFCHCLSQHVTLRGLVPKLLCGCRRTWPSSLSLSLLGNGRLLVACGLPDCRAGFGDVIVHDGLLEASRLLSTLNRSLVPSLLLGFRSTWPRLPPTGLLLSELCYLMTFLPFISQRRGTDDTGPISLQEVSLVGPPLPHFGSLAVSEVQPLHRQTLLTGARANMRLLSSSLSEQHMRTLSACEALDFSVDFSRSWVLFQFDACLDSFLRSFLLLNLFPFLRLWLRGL